MLLLLVGQEALEVTPVAVVVVVQVLLVCQA